MPTPLRRILRYGILTVAALPAAGILYTMFIYHNINILTPPGRLESLGRTYQLSNLRPSTLEEIRQRHSPSHREHYTLEHVSNLWPRHPIYQFQNNESQGQATTDQPDVGGVWPLVVTTSRPAFALPIAIATNGTVKTNASTTDN